jgi:hypothetical protein
VAVTWPLMPCIGRRVVSRDARRRKGSDEAGGSAGIMSSNKALCQYMINSKEGWGNTVRACMVSTYNSAAGLIKV